MARFDEDDFGCIYPNIFEISIRIPLSFLVNFLQSKNFHHKETNNLFTVIEPRSGKGS
jgi:hypothetical protein